MKKLAMVTAFVIATLTQLADAKEHTVKLLTADNKGQTMIMSPGYLKVAKGDTVTFVPSDATHNVESISLPSKAEKFITPMGEKFSITFKEKGVYLYKCTPHFALGMLGLIQVDSAVNIEQVKNDWATLSAGVVMNKERFAQYLSKVK